MNDKKVEWARLKAAELEHLLLPCPFCGGAATFAVAAAVLNYQGLLAWCGCPDCKVFIETNRADLDDLFARWNRRHGECVVTIT